MTSSTLTLNGVTDAQMAKILQFKSEHEKEVRAELGQYGQSGTQSAEIHDNVKLICNSDASLKVVLGFVQTLLP